MRAISSRERTSYAPLSLKSKMAFIVSCLLLITVSVIILISSAHYENNLKTTISNQQNMLASTLANSIDDKFRMAQHALVAGASVVPQPALQGDVKAAKQFLDNRHGLHALFDELFLLSAEGLLIADSPIHYVYKNSDFSYRQYYKKTLATKSPQVSDPFRYLPTKQPAVVLTAPILDAQNQLQAVLVGTLLLLEDNFLTKLSLTQISKNSYLSIFDRTGTFIIHPDKERILSKNLPSEAQQVFDDAIAGAERTFETYNSRGELSLSSFKQLQTADWILGISFPLKETYAALATSREYVLLSLFPLMALSLLLTWWAMNRFLVPLQLLANKIDNVSGTSLKELSFVTYRNDEVGRLAKSFSTLMVNLNQQYERLGEAKSQAETEKAKADAIIAAIGDALIIRNLDFEILYQNPAAVDLLGDHVGKRCYNAIYNLDQNCSECTHKLTFREGQTHTVGKWLKLRDKLLFLEKTSTPVRDTDGQIIAGVQIIRDRTERQQADERIRNLSWAVEQSPAEVVITSPKGHIEFVNHRFTEATGYTAEEVLGRHTNFLQVDELSKQQEQKIWEIVIAGGEWQGELRHRKKNGEAYWLQVSFAPIRNEAGSITNFLGIGVDISKRKRLEEQLRQSQKMEAVGQLAAGVAHDFNNILTAIKGYVGLQMLKAEKDSQLMIDLWQISIAADRGANLIEDLLTFSRERTPKLERADLNTIIKQSLSLMHSLIGKRIEIDTKLNSSTLPVLADSVHFEQVLMNLASNAKDAMPQGGRLTITTEQISLSHGDSVYGEHELVGDYALLRLSDSGGGMDRETVEKIFEPFFTTKEIGKGTGLGLAVSYSIIKQHQGHISCESKLGKGTVFQVYLPLRH